MRSMRLTSSYDGTKVAIVPINVGNVFRPPTLDYTIVRPAQGGLPDIHVTETPDVVFHELDAALAETIMTENTDAESYSGLGRRLTEGFDHVVESIDLASDRISDSIDIGNGLVKTDAVELPTVPPERWDGTGGVTKI